MIHELKADCGLFNLLSHRADVELAFLREATQHNAELNANVERILNAPLRHLDQSGEVVAPAGKEVENGLE